MVFPTKLRALDDRWRAFAGGAPRSLVERHLGTLALMGEVQELGGGRYAAALVAA